MQQTFTNGQHDEHYKIVIVGGGLVSMTFEFRYGIQFSC